LFEFAFSAEIAIREENPTGNETVPLCLRIAALRKLQGPGFNTIFLSLLLE